jgi:hypothetical protein
MSPASGTNVGSSRGARVLRNERSRRDERGPSDERSPRSTDSPRGAGSPKDAGGGDQSSMARRPAMTAPRCSRARMKRTLLAPRGSCMLLERPAGGNRREKR